MKQVLQNLKSGITEVAEVPSPALGEGQLLILTRSSLISAGTERMVVDFGKANLLEKALQQPAKVGMVIDKVRTDGFLPTLELVQNKLDQPIAMGYCNAGEVIAVGTRANGFRIGDRVVSNGKHAEVVAVPANLCAKIPDNVSFDQAVFTVIASIALQGIRLTQPTLGENFAVFGMGLIGLITAQLLRACGCRVLGIDLDAERLKLAEEFGIQTVNLSQGADPVKAAQGFSNGNGIDGVLVTVATKSDEPMHQAASMCRKRGRIVLIGVTGLNLKREDFYEKELTFQVSCSYGPGRYDPLYEEGGQDYPIGFVRWTEQRNFAAILEMFSENRLDCERLISHRFKLVDAAKAYEVISGAQRSLAIVLDYDPPVSVRTSKDRVVNLLKPVAPKQGPIIGFIGAGGYGFNVLIPAFRKTNVRLKSIASVSGVSGFHAGRKYGFEQTTTDISSIFSDTAITSVVIATRHNNHSDLVCEALTAGKHVFVEKPLTINELQLRAVEAAYGLAQSQGQNPVLMVGFNRRFSPLTRKMKALLDTVKEPKTFIYTVNAGFIPEDHWTQNPTIGGGRIIGEGCHFIDLLRFLAGAPITDSQAMTIGQSNGNVRRDDKLSFTLSFSDGSMGTVHYFSNGHKSFPKERLEVFAAGRVLRLDNFRRLESFGWSGFSGCKLWKQDKGNLSCAAGFVSAITRGEGSPIPYDEIVEVTRVSFDIANQCAKSS